MKSPRPTRVGTFFLITIFILFCFCYCKTSVAEEQSPVAIAEHACAGFYSAKAKGEKGTVKFENYQITEDAGGDLTIEENGILLKKVQNFTYQDYTSCLVKLTEILKGIKPGAMLHILNELKFGESGITSLKYVETLLGIPREDDNRGRAVFQKGGYEIQVQYYENEVISPYKPLKFIPAGTIFAVEVSVDYGVDDNSRKEISFRTYWNQPSCNDKGENCHTLVKDGAVLGRTTLKDFWSSNCWTTKNKKGKNETAVFPSPPIYACAGEAQVRNGNRSGNIAIVLFLRPPTGQILGELNDLEDIIQYHVSGGTGRITTRAEVQELEKRYNITDLYKSIWEARMERLEKLVVDGILVSSDPTNVKWFPPPPIWREG
jgi:hypothetical protein